MNRRDFLGALGRRFRGGRMASLALRRVIPPSRGRVRRALVVGDGPTGASAALRRVRGGGLRSGAGRPGRAPTGRGAPSPGSTAPAICRAQPARRSGTMAVGPDLLAMLQAARRFHRITGGAFDPAVEPLMRAWGFHAPRTSEPSRAELAEARAAVLAARIEVPGRRVALASKATQLDLGGIGVGYGLDRAGGRAAAGRHRARLPRRERGLLGRRRSPRRDRLAGGVADPAVGRGHHRDASPGRGARHLIQPGVGGAVRAGSAGPRHGSGQGWPAVRCRQVTIVARTGIEADALSTATLVCPERFPGVLPAPASCEPAGQRVESAFVVSRALDRSRSATRARSRSSTRCLPCQSSDGALHRAR